MGYINFSNEADAEKWIGFNYGEFISEIQNLIEQDERSYADIIYEYGGSAYKGFNRILREVNGKTNLIKGNTNKENYENLFYEIDILTECINRYPILEDICVYRYIKFSLTKIFKYLKMQPNDILIEHGFMSTTLLPYSKGMKDLVKQQEYNMLFKINVQKGIPSIPLIFNKKQTLLKEYEMLFSPDIRLRLVKKSFDLRARMILLVFDLD